MNRKILFRGKDINEDWHIGLLSHIGNAWYITNEGTPQKTIEVIPYTIGEFTGVYDMYKNRIFEGDVLRKHQSGYICIVKFHDGEFIGVDSRGDYCHCQAKFFNEFEIIGNCYEVV